MKAIFLTPVLLCLALGSCKGGDVQCELQVKVTDGDGVPVEGAEVRVRYPVGLLPNPGGGFPTDAHEITTATTNVGGEATLQYQTVSSPEGLLWVKKDRHYMTTWSEFEWERVGGDFRNCRASVDLVLRPIRKPVAMFAYSNLGDMAKSVRIPEIGRKYGFDLKVAEALPPLGNGKYADFIFWIEGSYDILGEHDLALHVEFQNSQDGVVEFVTQQRKGKREPEMNGSLLLSEHLAPENGYQSHLTRTTLRKNIEQQAVRNEDHRRNFYFRTLTEVDSSGRILSTHYGKIYGDFHFNAANPEWGYLATFALITTYFNPTPNDRNVEFDPKRNLHPEGNVDRP
jgi:hypothetical protein